MSAIWVAMSQTSLRALNKYSDKTMWMSRLILILAVRTCQIVSYAGYRLINNI